MCMSAAGTYRSVGFASLARIGLGLSSSLLHAGLLGGSLLSVSLSGGFRGWLLGISLLGAGGLAGSLLSRL